MSHTKGPWTPSNNDGFGKWRISGVGRPLCDVFGDSAETDANAYLIAAAPELLAALIYLEGRVEQASRAIHDSTRWDEEEMEDCVSIWDWIFADARAAIEKATGNE